MISDPAALAPGELEQLLTVRAMLDGAQRAASTRMSVDVITPTVLLDAVAERATHLVAVSLGVSVGQHAGINELIPRISAQIGSAWSPTTLPDIRQLHRVRNSAQHEGVAPDPARLPNWSIAVAAFVRSLIAARFGVDLERIALSDAIHDAELRERIVEAADDLADGKFGIAVLRCLGVVDTAVARWRLLHGSRRGNLPPTTSRLLGVLGSDSLRPEVERLGRLTDLTAFARDAADAAWFDTLPSIAEDLLDQDDAERALGFATWWVIGFESAAGTWVPDRQYRRNVAARLVRVGDGPARIDSVVSLEAARFGEGWDLVVRLGDQPDEASWHSWCASVDALMEQGTATGSPRWYVGDDGTAAISNTSPTTFTQHLEQLRDALLAAEGFETRAAEQDAATAAARRAEEQAYVDSVAAAGPLPTWVTDVGTIRAEWAPTLLFTLIWLDPRALAVKASNGGLLVPQAFESLPGVETVYVLGSEVLRVESLVDPHDLAAVLGGIDAQVQAGIAEKESARLQLESDTDQLRNAITRAIEGMAREAASRPERQQEPSVEPTP